MAYCAVKKRDQALFNAYEDWAISTNDVFKQLNHLLVMIQRLIKCQFVSLKLLSVIYLDLIFYYM